MSKLSRKTKSEKVETRSANLYVRQWERLDQIAAAEGWLRSEVLRQVVDWGFAHYDSLPESGGGGGKK